MAEPLTPDPMLLTHVGVGNIRRCINPLCDQLSSQSHKPDCGVGQYLDAARAAALSGERKPCGHRGDCEHGDGKVLIGATPHPEPTPDPAGLREAAQLYRSQHDAECGCEGCDAYDSAAALATPASLDEAEPSYIEVRTTACHAGSDGDCSWSECPQLRDGEPTATGRHCPLDRMPTSPAETARRFPLATAYAAAPGPVGLPEREYGTLRDRCVHSPCCMTLRQHDERIVPSPDPVGLREALDTPENHDPEGHDALPDPVGLREALTEWGKGFLDGLSQPTPLDVERVARALHNTASASHRHRYAEVGAVSGDGRDACEFDAGEVAAEYARLTEDTRRG